MTLASRFAWTLAAVASLTIAPALSAAERLELVAGAGDMASLSAEGLNNPFGMAIASDGTLYFVELAGNRVAKITSDGTVTTLAGGGAKGDSGDDGPAAAAVLNGPHSLLLDAEGDIYIADTWNNRVRKIDPTSGRITTFAGTGVKGFAGDGGHAEQAQFGGIYAIAFNHDQSQLYLADLDNRRVRAIDMATRVVTTIAGNGQRGVPTDGALAIESPLVDPRAMAADSQGNVYILERGGHALRVVGRDGKIRTVVGTGDKGSKGDGGDALAAEMNGPKHLCVDEHDNVIIADAENHLIRRYVPATGRIERVAGTGRKGTAGLGGPPAEAELSRPHGVYIDSHGTLFITDSHNDRILKIVD